MRYFVVYGGTWVLISRDTLRLSVHSREYLALIDAETIFLIFRPASALTSTLLELFASQSLFSLIVAEALAVVYCHTTVGDTVTCSLLATKEQLASELLVHS